MEEPHHTLRCLTGPGAGKALVWRVLVSGQASTSPSTAYAPPTVTAVQCTSVASVHDLGSRGGDVLVRAHPETHTRASALLCSVYGVSRLSPSRVVSRCWLLLHMFPVLTP